MPNAYNIRWGIVFSLSIALLISVPMLIHQDIAQFAFSTGLFFIPILVCYFAAYYLRAKMQLRNSRLTTEEGNGKGLQKDLFIVTILLLEP
jgi:hypothetical protein